MARNPGLFSPAEFCALLDVHVPGRDVSDEQRARLARLVGLDSGGGGGLVFSLNSAMDSIYTQGQALSTGLRALGADLKDKLGGIGDKIGDAAVAAAAALNPLRPTAAAAHADGAFSDDEDLT